MVAYEGLKDCRMLSWSILQYFWPALSDNRSWKPNFSRFEIGCFTQVLLFYTGFSASFLKVSIVANFQNLIFYSRYFFYEETEESKVTRNIGNVTADTEITFEFGVRTKPKSKHKYKYS